MTYYLDIGVYDKTYNGQICECVIPRARGAILSCMIFDEQSRGLCGATKLMLLVSSELKLNGGRFERFDPNIKTNAKAYASTDASLAFKAIVEWVAENTTGKWNFHVGRRVGSSVHENSYENYIITLFFEHEEDSVWYRLNLP